MLGPVQNNRNRPRVSGLLRRNLVRLHRCDSESAREGESETGGYMLQKTIDVQKDASARFTAEVRKDAAAEAEILDPLPQFTGVKQHLLVLQCQRIHRACAVSVRVIRPSPALQVAAPGLQDILTA